MWSTVAEDVYRWLRKLGFRDEIVLRALRLAKRSIVASMSSGWAVVIVPSQRLGKLSRERIVSHTDLYWLLTGRGYRVSSVRVGKLPVSQQFYMVRVTKRGAWCPCPLSRYSARICVHKLAAAIVLYQRGRRDLLTWLERRASRVLDKGTGSSPPSPQ